MYLYAFMAILLPKLVALVMPLCPLCTGVSDEFPNSTNPISEPNSAWICCLFWPEFDKISRIRALEALRNALYKFSTYLLT